MRLGLGMRLSDILKGGAAAVVPKSTLVDDLVSYWSLDEVSGTRSDLVGDNDLTDNNTVGYDTGKNGNAASFVAANEEGLAIVSPSGIPAGDTDFSVAAWINVTNGATWATPLFYGIYGASYNWLVITGDGHIYFQMYDGGTAKGSATWGSTINDGNWHSLVCWYTAATNTSSISIDNETAVDQVLTGAPSSSETPFAIGSWVNAAGGSVGYYMAGLVDEVAIWSRVLTSDERAELYNSGAGKFYNATSEDFEE